MKAHLLQHKTLFRTISSSTVLPKRKFASPTKVATYKTFRILVSRKTYELKLHFQSLIYGA